MSDLSARVARIAIQNGVHIKPFSLGFVTNRISGSAEPSSDAEILERLRTLAKEHPGQFGLGKADPVQNPRERAISNLENANAHAELVRPERKDSGKLKLTKGQKETFRRWGPGALLDAANTATATAPAFEDESNSDEP
jgi:hypothetical protein